VRETRESSVRQQTCSETDTKREDKDGSYGKGLLFRRFLFLGRYCVTNLMGAASRMRAAKGLFGKLAVHWFPNWWECSEMADFIGLFFGCLSSNEMHSGQWSDVALRSQEHRNKMHI